jgi:hypothetical protein
MVSFPAVAGVDRVVSLFEKPPFAVHRCEAHHILSCGRSRKLLLKSRFSEGRERFLPQYVALAAACEALRAPEVEARNEWRKEEGDGGQRELDECTGAA